MQYNRLGTAGLKVSELSYGSWVNFGNQVDVAAAKELMRIAWEAGVNFFDNAEAYNNGVAESVMGIALKEYRREDLVISTKIYWGGSAPNQTGLNRKHLIEGTTNSLKRLQLDYVDLLFCHRPDPDTPVEETVLTMDMIVRSGLAFYWGTSEWSAEDIKKAYEFAQEYHCVPPAMEQPQYNMFVRTKLEREYLPLFEHYGLGTTIWSPLLSGVLSGKYAEGIPKGSRISNLAWLKEWLEKEGLFGEEIFGKIKKLGEIAGDLGCTMPQLAIAWCLKNPNVSTVILGARNADQLRENLGAADVKEKLDGGIMSTIEAVLQSKPA